MTEKKTHAEIAAENLAQAQAKRDAEIHNKMVALASHEDSDRYRRYMASLSPSERADTNQALERHRQRGIAKGEPGW
jgi:hypothetical protein